MKCSCKDFYLQQAQTGASLYPVYQQGRGIFSTIGRLLRPLFKSATRAAAPVVKRLGREVIRSAKPALLKHTVQGIADIAAGENVGRVLKRRAKGVVEEAGSDLFKKAKTHFGGRRRAKRCNKTRTIQPINF